MLNLKMFSTNQLIKIAFNVYFKNLCFYVYIFIFVPRDSSPLMKNAIKNMGKFGGKLACFSTSACLCHFFLLFPQRR